MNTLDTGRKTKLKHITYHAGAWALYVSFIFGANFIANRGLQLLPTIFFLLPLCITFYLAIYFLNKFRHKGIWGIIYAFVITFIIMATFGYAYIYVILPPLGMVLYGTSSLQHYLKSAILGYVQYFSYALLYFYVRELVRKEKHLRKVEADKLQNELETARLKEQELQAQQDKISMEFAFLRAQVNPHFLHNTLNVLYEQAMDYSPDLAANISKLSRIMRYSLDNIEQTVDRVPVEQELEQLQLLIDFHRLRFADTKLIHYVMEGNADGQYVPKLSLVTIVENAFKHGDLKDAQHPLEIKVKLEEGIVLFFCRNKKLPNVLNLSSHNIGISNLKKRLNVAFAGQYDMQVKEDECFYEMKLTIKS